MEVTLPSGLSGADLTTLDAAIAEGIGSVETAITTDAALVAGHTYRVTPVSRSITDGVTTAGSTTVGSPAQANFVAGDVGSFLVGANSPTLATIASVASGTSAAINKPVPLTGTARTWSIVKPLTVTLPTGAAGDRIHVIKSDGKLATVTIAAPGGGTVNAAASAGLSSPRGTVLLICAAPGVWTAVGADSIEQGPTTFRAFPVIRAADSHVGNVDAQVIGKAYGSGDVGTWEAWHNDTQGNIVHFNCAPGMQGTNGVAALFGLGCDYTGTGIYLHNRVTGGGGIGLKVSMDQDLTWSRARGILVSQGSGAGIGAEFIQSPATTTPGPVVKIWTQIALATNQKQMVWYKADPGSVNDGILAGWVNGYDGSWNWLAPTILQPSAVDEKPLHILGLSGQTANLTEWYTANGPGTVASMSPAGALTIASGLTASAVLASGAGAFLAFYDTSGTANSRRFKFSQNTSTLLLTARNDADTSLRTLLQIHHTTGAITPLDGGHFVLGTTTGTKFGTAASQKLGFYGATPVVQPSATPAAATDPATTQALVNDLRSKLLTLGLIAA